MTLFPFLEGWYSNYSVMLQLMGVWMVCTTAPSDYPPLLLLRASCCAFCSSHEEAVSIFNLKNFISGEISTSLCMMGCASIHLGHGRLCLWSLLRGYQAAPAAVQSLVTPECHILPSPCLGNLADPPGVCRGCCSHCSALYSCGDTLEETALRCISCALSSRVCF